MCRLCSALAILIIVLNLMCITNNNNAICIAILLTLSVKSNLLIELMHPQNKYHHSQQNQSQQTIKIF